MDICRRLSIIAVALALAGAASGRTYVVSTVAGTAGYGYSNTDPIKFALPQGVAVADDLSVYVADTYNRCVRRIATNGTVSTVAGRPWNQYGDGPVDTAGLYGVVGIAIDSSGTIYVSEPAYNVIRKISHGQVTTFAGAVNESGSTDGPGTSARFNAPVGLAVDGSGNLYVADGGNALIRMITPAGIVSTIAGRVGSTTSTDGATSVATFEYPEGLTVDSTGAIYVADFDASTVRKIANGVVSTVAGLADQTGNQDGNGTAARFENPSGIAIDTRGYLYVTDYYAHTVRQISPTGDVLTAGQPYRAGYVNGDYQTSRFNHPIAIASDRGGNIFVADRDNEVIRMLVPSGSIVTYAGTIGGGANDGVRAAARFFQPRGLAYDAAGNLYIADTYNHLVRKMTPGGTVTTLAGAARVSGSADGAGDSARFYFPYSVAADGAGNVFVADFANHAIRKINSAGVVVTIAGSGVAGSSDGDGAAASFRFPSDLKFDGSGNLIVADSGNHTLRKVTPTGTVTTIAGAAGVAGFANGSSATARFNEPWCVAIDANGVIYVGDTGNALLRKISPTGQVSTVAGVAGSADLVDGVVGVGEFGSLTGLAVDGAGNIYVADPANEAIRAVTPQGTISTIVGDGYAGYSDGLGDSARLMSPSAVALDPSGNLAFSDGENNVIRHAGELLPANPPSSIINLSVRVNLLANNRLITGFVVSGAPQSILIRGVGPGLAPYVSGATTAGDPRLELYDSLATLEQSNDDWGGTQALRDAFNRVGAFPIPQDSRDAALLASMTGLHSAHVLSPTDGLAIVEAYNASDSTTGRLINVSARYTVGSGAGALVAGFVISGSAPKTVLIRGIGPTLGTFGIGGTITNPVLSIYDSSQEKIATNDDWDAALASTFQTVGAFGLAARSKDAALLITLPPGLYSAQLDNGDRQTGEGMIEVYDVGN